MLQPEKNAHLIKFKASQLGFLNCRIAKAEYLEDEAPRLYQWLHENRNAQMAYMENYFDKRLDPRLLVDGAKSVISFSFNYFTHVNHQQDELKISRYALGEDYHLVLKDKLAELVTFIQTEIGEINCRTFVDSAPVLEKAWAAKSGIGWVGKNANIISKQQGSFFFLCELICDLELASDMPVSDHCGNCTRCIDACPTQAIYEPYHIDAGKCISYFTIELKDQIPDTFKGTFDNWIFGCDICQEVCPWNRFSKQHNEPRFNANPKLTDMKRKEWIELTEEIYHDIVKKSPLKRPKYNGLKRNIDFVAGK